MDDDDDNVYELQMNSVWWCDVVLSICDLCVTSDTVTVA